MMKKVFWTSVVWIALLALFILYMKWFNQPLAQGMSNFIVKGEKNIEIDLVKDDNALLDEDIVDEAELVEDVIETKVTETITYDQTNWEVLFKQLDRIEKTISDGDKILETKDLDEKTQEEMFDEFKLWYEENRK